MFADENTFDALKNPGKIISKPLFVAPVLKVSYKAPVALPLQNPLSRLMINSLGQSAASRLGGGGFLIFLLFSSFKVVHPSMIW